MENLNTRQVAENLDVPHKLIVALRRRDYRRCSRILNEIDEDARLYRQHWKKVERVKETFSELYGRSPYYTQTPRDMEQEYDATIARYVEHLGVEVLEKEMRRHTRRSFTIRSIVFFFMSKTQDAPWQRLLQDKNAGQREPEWVKNDRKRYMQIQNDLFSHGYPVHIRKDMMREMNAIKYRLNDHGWEIK